MPVELEDVFRISSRSLHLFPLFFWLSFDAFEVKNMAKQYNMGGVMTLRNSVVK